MGANGSCGVHEAYVEAARRAGATLVVVRRGEASVLDAIRGASARAALDAGAVYALAVDRDTRARGATIPAGATVLCYRTGVAVAVGPEPRGRLLERMIADGGAQPECGVCMETPPRALRCGTCANALCPACADLLIDRRCPYCRGSFGA